MERTQTISEQRFYDIEGVSGIIEWAKTQPEIKAIIASTDKTNTASFKVLEKNSFIKIGETESLFNWKLVIKSKNEITGK
ncbi:MAG: GNAT family N-acetyltransferase [Flammeovirgaceae bacterium]|nr:GNAT family N-acetyltransferase [Flammeovirgaceae bacterium]